MKTGSPPDPNALHPIPGCANEIHPVDEIQSLIPLLTSGDLEYLRRELRRRLAT